MDKQPAIIYDFVLRMHENPNIISLKFDEKQQKQNWS